MVNKTYSKLGFAYQVFQSEREIFKMKHGSSNVMEYYNKFRELYMYQDVKIKCAKDTLKLNWVVEKERIFQFLKALIFYMNMCVIMFWAKKLFQILLKPSLLFRELKTSVNF